MTQRNVREERRGPDKFIDECMDCFEIAPCVPVRFQCLGASFTLKLCLSCRLQPSDRGENIRSYSSRRDEWLHLPTIWPKYAATGDDQLSEL